MTSSRTAAAKKSKSSANSQNAKSVTAEALISAAGVTTPGRWLFSPFLIVITIAVFWQVLRNDFVWDDHVNIVENPYVAGSSFTALLRFWDRPYAYLYVPFPYTVWFVVARAALAWNLLTGGTQVGPGAYHALNLLIHVAAVLIVFSILRKIVRDEWGACAGAALFALHPMQVEPVAWITGLKDVLAGLLSLVATWQYVKYADSLRDGTTKDAKVANRLSRSRLHYLAAMAAFVLALLSKPTAAVVPLALWVLDVCVVGRSIKQATSATAGWLLLIVPIAIITKTAQGAEVLDYSAPFWFRPLMMADAIGFYVYKFAFPLSLGVDYGRSSRWFVEEGWVYFVWLMPCALAPLIWFSGKRRQWLMAAAALFVIGILPVSGLLPFAFQNISTVADRYLYFSMLGPAMALSFFIAEGKYKYKPVVLITVAVLSLFAIKSAVQVQTWRDERTLFSHALALNSESWISRNNLAYVLFRKGDLDGAVAQYEAVLRQKPEFVDAINNLGSIFARQGKFDQAIARYNQALQINPASAQAHTNLANVLVARGETDKAIYHYRLAVRIDPEDFEAHQNLGNLLFNRDASEEAIEHLMIAVKANAANSDAYNNLAIALAKTGRISMAIDFLTAALRYYPNDADTHNNLGIALAGVGRLEEGVEHFRQAVRLRPNFAQAEENLTRALKMLDNTTR